MVECAGLENQLGGNSYEGSNPSLSANFQVFAKYSQQIGKTSDVLGVTLQMLPIEV